MKKQGVIVSFIILGLVVLYASFYYGKIQGEKNGITQGEKKLAPIIDLAFPKPSNDIRQLNGVIKNIQGATIYLKINSIDDYLPHIDGSPRKTEIRYITVTSKTILKSIDTTRLDKNGNPLSKKILFSYIKKGDDVNVRANKNIKNEQKFDATYIQIVK